MIGCHLGLFFFFDQADPCLGESWKWVADSFFSWLVTFLRNSEKWVMEKSWVTAEVLSVLRDNRKHLEGLWPLLWATHKWEYSSDANLRCHEEVKLCFDARLFFFNTSLAVAEQTGWHTGIHILVLTKVNMQIDSSKLPPCKHKPVSTFFLLSYIMSIHIPIPHLFLSGPSFSLSFAVPP